MFLETSRYHTVPKDEATAGDGRTVSIVRLRRPRDVAGGLFTVKQYDRLDLIAQRRYDDPTRFWRIADANTELEARDLVATPGRVIQIPEP